MTPVVTTFLPHGHKKNLYSRRIRLYTRRLAEIERFIENVSTGVSSFGEDVDTGIVIHKYWQS